jgi:uncharacterized protein YlaI
VAVAVRDDDGSAAWLREWNRGHVDAPAIKVGGAIQVCQKCGKEFTRVKGSTGVKYCGRECQTSAWKVQITEWAETHKGETTYLCGACEKRFAWTPEGVRSIKFGLRLVLCADCAGRVRHVLNRLRSHRVPVETIYAIARTGEAECPVCGVDIMTPQRAPGGDDRILMVVDHDHRCCPGQVSKCGKCVRGLLCFRCNVVAGMLDEDPDIARALADHLRNRPALRVVS